MALIVREFAFPTTEKRQFEIMMPAGAKILNVDVVHERPRLYALVDTDAPSRMRLFSVYGNNRTLNEMPDDLSYVGTFHIYGETTWHLFEIVTHEMGVVR